MQLLQEEQPMPVWTQGEQQKTELLLRKQYVVQLLQGEQQMAELLQREVGAGAGASPPLKLDLSLSQREHQVKEGGGLASLYIWTSLPAATVQRKSPPRSGNARRRRGRGLASF